MTRAPLSALVIVATLLATSAAPARQRYTPPTGADIEPLPLGSSCTPAASAELDRGAALLVVLADREARRTFERAAVADPDCALGYWGQAVSHLPSASDTLTASALDAGAAAMRRAKAVTARTALERGLIDSAAALFTPPAGTPIGARLDAYQTRLRLLADTHRDRDAIAILHARAILLRTTLPGDAARLRARQVIESVFVHRPLPPGAAVALIESWEGTPAPAMAERAADAVARVRRPQPHHLALRALVAAGLWARAKEAGERALSSVTSLASPDLLYGSARDYAGEWLAAACLQRGEEAEFRARVQQMAADFKRADLDDHDRRALETGMVRAAARGWLDRRDMSAGSTTVADQDWSHRFAYGLSAAWLAWPGGNPSRLQEATREAEALGERERGDGASERDLARTLIEAAASASQDEHAQTALFLTHAGALETQLLESGRLSLPLQPAHELAAEIWLRYYRYQDAEREARAAQARFPNRWRTLLTLARATAALGRPDEARALYLQIEAMRSKESPDDPVLAEVRRALR